MFGSFLPSLWSSSNQSVLRSREPTLLCNHVPRASDFTHYKRVPLFGVGFECLAQPLQKGTPFMTSTKYIGMDVHKESISIAVMNAAGKMVMECVIETKANMILQCIDGLRGDLHVTFEEGTSAAWLYDLLKPHVTELIVCDPRKNASMREDSQNDKIDARRLAELLRIDHLSPVYHGEHGLRTLKELVRSYLTVTKDLVRVKTRVKALYRSWAIPCNG